MNLHKYPKSYCSAYCIGHLIPSKNMELIQRPTSRTTCIISAHGFDFFTEFKTNSAHALACSCKETDIWGKSANSLQEMNTSWHFWNSTLIGQATSDIGAQPILSWLSGLFWDFYSPKFLRTQHSLRSALSVSMTYSLGILLCVGLLHPIVRAIRMDKLADTKICGDAECSCKSE